MWRSLVSSSDSKFFVRGTELSYIICGPLSRFAVYEVRSMGTDGYPDRRFRIRDAHTVSDADLREGKRPAVVATLDTMEEVEQFIGAQQ